MIASNSVRWLLNDCCLYEPSASGKLQLNIIELAGNLAYHAMMLEAHLTPKAGLVDCVSSGAHSDMDINTFIVSSEALRPYMKQFVQVGLEMHNQPAETLLPALRKVGIAAEKAMFAATENINTHKGMIFTLGLICGAVGWLYKQNLEYNARNIRNVIMQCCTDLIDRDLKTSDKPPVTAGEKLYRTYGMTGIRGEAACGYPTIFIHGLPVYEECISRGYSEEQAMSKTLLSLMAHNCDTNLVSRGGLKGLTFVQKQSKLLLADESCTNADFEKSMTKLDKELINLNLSPGGSADLLAATWLLAQLNLCSG